MKLSDIPPDEFAHFGVKGQKWGVRNEKKSAKTERTPEESAARKSKQKKAAVVLGTAAAVTAVAAGTYFAKKHLDAKISNDISEQAVKFAESIAKEPVGIVHSSRGKYSGFQFLRDGGLGDALPEYVRSGLDTPAGDQPGFFNRYGNSLEKVAATFNDPEGRRDSAGRVIPHAVMLPESLAKGVNSADEAQAVAWPLIKDTFGALYEATLKPRY